MTTDPIACGPRAGMAPEPWLGATVWCHADQPRTLVALLDHAVRTHPDRTAAIAPQGTVTYRELAELVEGAAAALSRELGLARGDRLAVALPNGLDLLVAIWASARAGLILVALPTRLAAPQWAHQLQQSEAVLALADARYLERLTAAGGDAGLAPDRILDAEDRFTRQRRPWRGTGDWEPTPDTVYGLIFTSGTTGRPKGSMVTHRGSMHAAVTYARTFELGPDDVTVLTFPLYYATAHMAQVAPMMLVGGTTVIVAEVSPPAIVRACAEHAVTYLMVVPALWPLLLRTPGFSGEALPAVRIGAFGGAPVPLSSVDQLREHVPGMKLFDAYGLTETHSPATILADGEFAERRGSVGRPIPGTCARIVDDHGADVPRGCPGELWLQGPNITPGYWNDAEGTAAAISADGWLATGDLARIDEHGYVYLLDRKKDMIIRGGFNVYCVEVEYALVDHPDVVEAAVVGAPDRLGSEYAVAYVVVRPGATLDPTEIRAHVTARIAAYAAPRRVHTVAALPRNRTGKVDKEALRARGR